jgi:hypothetical protein
MTHANEFKASGNSPTADFLVENHGSICLLQPLSPAARRWIHQHISPDHQVFGTAVVIEPRYLEPIFHGIVEDGLVVL